MQPKPKSVFETLTAVQPNERLRLETEPGELSMRILGAYIDGQKAHDVFFFEQEGTYVLRLFGVAGSHGAGHQLSEFTRDEMLAMIESAPDQRQPEPDPQQPAPETTGAK